MKSCLFLVTFFVATSAWAGECRNSIKAILGSAKATVVQNFEKDSNCYNSAMIGRLYGPPGCFPPEAFELKSKLTPYFKKVTAVCKAACTEEGLADECLSLTELSTLRENGIEGLLQIISGSEFN